ncbi:MAG TPA: efflux transporter outer membrane subunit, partial [Magnetococcales bacterium]|nr:efflux transporter outer membrane subunit [Magnetococcales bacterium]
MRGRFLYCFSIWRPSFLAMLLLLLAGCGWTQDDPVPKVNMPQSWALGVSRVTDTLKIDGVADSWWREFGSVTLNDLQQTALSYNDDLKASVARLTQAEAQLRMAGASFLPSLELKTSDQVAQGSSNTGRSSSSRVSAEGSGSQRSMRADLSASYEIDFWGRQAATQESAAAMRDVGGFDRDIVALTLTADVATTYFKILTLKSRIDKIKENRETALQIQRLVGQQVTYGKALPMENLQQQNIIANLDAQVAALELQYAQALNALTLFSGKPQGELQRVTEVLTDINLPTIAPGLPSDLLQRRPDIRRAEANLQAANADIRVARAALFPTVQLTGDRGYASDSIKNLLTPESILWSFGAALTATIFDNGRTQGAIEVAEAKQSAWVAAYRQTIMAAL